MENGSTAANGTRRTGHPWPAGFFVALATLLAVLAMLDGAMGVTTDRPGAFGAWLVAAILYGRAAAVKRHEGAWEHTWGHGTLRGPSAWPS